MNRATRPAGIRWPRNATERAIWAVIANWHIAGILRELRGQVA